MKTLDPGDNKGQILIIRISGRILFEIHPFFSNPFPLIINDGGSVFFPRRGCKGFS